MTPNRSVLLLQNAVSDTLARNGYRYVVGNDMDEWRSMRLRKGARIPNTFDPAFCDQSQAKFISILDQDGDVAATRAWRNLETDDFVDAIESGKVWVDDPKARGWERFSTGIDRSTAPSDTGWISIGGAMQSFVKGKKLSWFLGALHWIFATQEGVDCTVKSAFRDIAAASIPTRLYGYRQQMELPERFYPHNGQRFALTLYWSSRQDAIDEIASRLELLRATNAQDLVGAVSPRDRVEVPEKPALFPVGELSGNSGQARPSKFPNDHEVLESAISE